MALTDKEYKDRLRISREYFNFNFDLRNKLTPQRKAAISRAYERYRRDIAPVLRAGGDFEAVGKRTRKKARQTVGKRFTTSKGYIIPPTRDGQGKSTFDKKNNRMITRYDSGLRFETYPIDDPVAFAKNPDAFLKGLPNYKNADHIRLNVGEGNYLGTQRYDKSIFKRYITQELEAMIKRSNQRRSKDIGVSDIISGVTLVFNPNDKATKKVTSKGKRRTK